MDPRCDELIKQAQDIVAAHEPLSGQFGHADYPLWRDNERYYWDIIARWLWEERQTGRIFSRSLDIGSLYGTLSIITKLLDTVDLYAVDITPILSPTLQADYNITYKHCDIESDEFPFDGTFDLILFTEVLEHLNYHPEKTLRRLVDRLDPGGWLCITTPILGQYPDPWPYKSYKDMPQPDDPKRPEHNQGHGHLCLYSKEDLDELAKSLGLVYTRYEIGSSQGTNRHHNLVFTRDM